MTLAEIEKAAVLSALHQCQWHRDRAAKALGITSRTLQNRIAEYREEGAMIPSWRQRRNVSRETENFSGQPIDVPRGSTESTGYAENAGG